jgi:uncharacterized protein (TIGR00369 family)
VSLRADITREILNERGQGYFPGHMGIEVLALTPGRVYARMPVQPHLLAPNGFLHAASVIALADTACGYGTIAHLPDGATSFTTIELKSNFLGTATEGALHCEARSEHMGRATQVWDATVTDEASGRKVALFRCTQMILWPRE